MAASELRPPNRPLVDADLAVLQHGQARDLATAVGARADVEWVRPAAAAREEALGRCVGDVPRFLHENWEREWWHHTVKGSTRGLGL